MKHRAAWFAVTLLLPAACAKESSAVRSSGSAAVTEATSLPPQSAPKASAAVETPTPRASDPTSGGSAPDDAPWVIHFDPLRISTLRNRTGRAYWVLHDHRLQSSRLEVTDPSGRVLSVFDTREIMKFDNTVRSENFVKVENGGELPLFRLHIAPHGDLFDLRWGPYAIGSLPAGTYKGTVTFEARRDLSDRATGKKLAREDVWMGTVRSAVVPFQVP